jgi:hypothetical protein
MDKLNHLITLIVFFFFTIQSFCQTFTVGSHKDEVLRIQGTPKTYNPNGLGNMEELEYNFSTVYISRSTQRVVKWTDISKVLKVRLLPGNNTTNLNYFTVGSHKDDVLRLQGTPKSYNPNALANMEELEYGYSTVYISRATSKVVKWTDISNVLKVRLGSDAEERLAEAISQKQKPQPETPKSVGNTNSSGNAKQSETVVTKTQTIKNPQVRTFKVEDKRYAIPLDKVEEFISKVPNCEEFVGFSIGEDKVDIPIIELPNFLENAKNPIARYNYPDFDVNLISSLANLKMFHEHLKNYYSYSLPFEQLQKDMQIEKNRERFFNILTTRVNIFVSYDVFKELIQLDIPGIEKGNTGFDRLVYDLYKQSGVGYEPTEQDVIEIKEKYNNDYRKFTTDFYKQAAIDYELTEEDFKGIETQYQLGQPKRISSEDFSGRIKEVYPEYRNMNDFFLAETFVKKYPIFKNLVTFNNSLSASPQEKQNALNADNKGARELLFYVDRIKIGYTEIKLPIPSEFVRIGESNKEQLELAELFVPKNNTLLAYYLGEKDLGDLLVTGSYNSDKYILIQTYKELIHRKGNSSDYQKFLKKFKDEYTRGLNEQLKAGANEAVENITESIHEEFELNHLETYPLGTYYESKNSLSFGVLSKMKYSFDEGVQEDYLMAVIATITKIDGKIVFLYLNKVYNDNADLDWLKATNDAWIREIERRQSPTHFLSEFDFREFRELIFAILFLSFLGAGYYATKKIYKKQDVSEFEESENNETISVEAISANEIIELTDEETNLEEYVDFDELLIRDNSLDEISNNIAEFEHITDNVSEIEQDKDQNTVEVVSDTNHQVKYGSVGGWLLFFCLSLVAFSPLRTLYNIYYSFEETSHLFDYYPGYKNILYFESLLSIAFMVYGIITGMALINIKPDAVDKAKKYLLVYLGYAFVSIFLPFMTDLPIENNDELTDEVAKRTAQGLVYIGIWYWYLSVSKRVKATYPETQLVIEE